MAHAADKLGLEAAADGVQHALEDHLPAGEELHGAR